MAQMGILNALITHLNKNKSGQQVADNKQTEASTTKTTSNVTQDNLAKSKNLEPQLTIPLFNPPTTIQKHNHREFLNNGGLLDLQNDLASNSAQWHFVHYKKPYGFNMENSPTFHDYDNDDDGSFLDLTINLHPHPGSTAAHLLGMMQQKLQSLHTYHANQQQQPQQPALIDYNAVRLLNGKLRNQQPLDWDHLAQLSCDSGEMIVRLNFSEPFKGIVYPDHNRLSPCRFFGDGHHNYELRLPLRGCGTRQAAPRVFVNDVVVRFHRSLELEEDEIKTLICRYPAPQLPLMTSGPQSTHNGSPFDNLHTDQFEFVDHGNQQRNNNNRLNPKNSLTQIDTFSENLLVATPQSIGPSNYQIKHNHQNNQLPNMNNNNNLNDFRLEPWQVVNGSNSKLPGMSNHQSLYKNNINNSNDANPQMNSPLIDPSASQTNNRLILDPNANNNPNRNTISDSNNNTNNSLQNTKLISSYGGTTSPVELLLLISSMMFLVLLALAFTTSYFCFQRRRRSHLSSRSNVLAAAASHFNPKGPSAASPASTLLGGGNGNSTNMCNTNLIAASYGPPMKRQHHMHHHYQQRPDTARSGRRHANNSNNNSTFWVPSGSASGGRQVVGGPTKDDINLRGGQRGRRAQVVGDHSQYVNRAFDHSERGINGPDQPKQRRLHRRWRNESQLVDAHLRDATLAPPAHGRMSQFRVPESSTNRGAGSNHAMGVSAADGLVEPHHVRSSEQQVWHNFESSTSTSPSDDNLSGEGSGHAIPEREFDPGRYVPLLNRTSSYNSPTTIGREKDYLNRQQQHFYNVDPFGLNANNRLHGIPQVKFNDNNQQHHQQRSYNMSKKHRELGQHQQQEDKQQEDKQQEYVYWNEQKSYYNHELLQQYQHVSFARHKHQYPNDIQVGGVLTSESSTTGDSGHSLPSIGDGVNTGDPSDGSHLPPNDEFSAGDTPKLVVKSIEDSYIRKLTEIDSQEYTSRDSRHALSLAEWRQCLANANAIAVNQQGQTTTVDKGVSKSGDCNKDKDQSDSNESWRDSGEASGSNLATNQLRSLSEVDISFAKAAKTNQTQVTQNTTDKMSRESGQLNISNDDEKSGLDRQTNKPSKYAGEIEAKPVDTVDSPDLMISPDYKVDDDSYHRVRQLRLRLPNSSDDKTVVKQSAHQSRVDSPPNSVSYV